MVYTELNAENLIKIDSVSSFIDAIKSLKDNEDGTSTELYFRGQEVEFWDVEPSIFRNDMLSIEHKLMQIPLQKIPMEFKELNTRFDIMTKYQHYGMCTRLLDLTTNPLVALYFACKQHGKEQYRIEGDIIEKEPYGVIYYTNKYYPSQTNDKEIKIVSALASYDLSKENTALEIFEKLIEDHIIDANTKEKWLKKEAFQEFVRVVQSNYMVIPTYTNERLKKQCGVFLLASLFSVDVLDDIEKSVISKAKGKLRDEFAEGYFYVDGEDKEEILKELDLYNINEATLFPELEHQLNYIRMVNKEYVQAVGDFARYEENSIANEKSICLDDDKLNKHIVDNLQQILKSAIDPDDIKAIEIILRNNFSVDWYKRDSIMSKIRRAIAGHYFIKYADKEKSKSKAMQISNLLSEEIENFNSLK